MAKTGEITRPLPMGAAILDKIGTFAISNYEKVLKCFETTGDSKIIITRHGEGRDRKQPRKQKRCISSPVLNSTVTNTVRNFEIFDQSAGVST